MVCKADIGFDIAFCVVKANLSAIKQKGTQDLCMPPGQMTGQNMFFLQICVRP